MTHKNVKRPQEIAQSIESVVKNAKDIQRDTTSYPIYGEQESGCASEHAQESDTATIHCARCHDVKHYKF